MSGAHDRAEAHATPMLEIAIALIVDFALGYSVAGECPADDMLFS